MCVCVCETVPRCEPLSETDVGVFGLGDENCEGCRCLNTFPLKIVGTVMKHADVKQLQPNPSETSGFSCSCLLPNLSCECFVTKV